MSEAERRALAALNILEALDRILVGRSMSSGTFDGRFYIALRDGVDTRFFWGDKPSEAFVELCEHHDEITNPGWSEPTADDIEAFS